MTDIRDLTIVQANDLIRQTNWKLNKTTIKLFKTLIACIDTYNPPKDNTVRIEKASLVKTLDSDMTNYDYLKAQLRHLQTSVKIHDDEQLEHYIALVTDIYWEKDSDIVSVTFHKDLMPFLLVSSNFLKYSAEVIPQFKSKYGIIIFENLFSREKQYNKGSYIISVDELRWITGTVSAYSKWVNFEKRVIKTAVDDINSINAPILVKYSKVKRGRNITDIKFYVRKRTSVFETNFDDVYRPEWL